MSRILTPVGWREINEEDVLTEEELEFATEEIVNALNVLIDYDIIDESALNELSPSTLSSYAKKASGERRKWAQAISPIRKTVAKLKSDGGDEAHRRGAAGSSQQPGQLLADPFAGHPAQARCGHPQSLAGGGRQVQAQLRDQAVAPQHPQRIGEEDPWTSQAQVALRKATASRDRQ